MKKLYEFTAHVGQCPICAEIIPDSAAICNYCGARATPTGWVQGAPPGAAGQRTNGMAIASLVLGLVWCYGVCSLLAAIFGHIARGQIQKSGGTQTGMGMAVAGIVLGWAGLGMTILLVIFGIFAELADF